MKKVILLSIIFSGCLAPDDTTYHCTSDHVETMTNVGANGQVTNSFYTVCDGGHNDTVKMIIVCPLNK